MIFPGRLNITCFSPYASEFTDAQIDTMADAGDFYLEESGFCLMPTKAEIEKMMVEEFRKSDARLFNQRKAITF